MQTPKKRCALSGVDDDTYCDVLASDILHTQQKLASLAHAPERAGKRLISAGLSYAERDLRALRIEPGGAAAPALREILTDKLMQLERGVLKATFDPHGGKAPACRRRAPTARRPSSARRRSRGCPTSSPSSSGCEPRRPRAAHKARGGQARRLEARLRQARHRQGRRRRCGRAAAAAATAPRAQASAVSSLMAAELDAERGSRRSRTRV